MPLTVKDMLEAAHAAVPRIDGAEAQRMVGAGALLLDIRDTPELDRTGRAVGAHHVPRGMLEFRADPASPFHDPEFRADRAIVLHCASGAQQGGEPRPATTARRPPRHSTRVAHVDVVARRGDTNTHIN